MSLQRVADLAGVDIAHISRVERGQSVPSVEVLARLAGALGLPELEQMLEPYRGAPSKKREPDLGRAQDSRSSSDEESYHHSPLHAAS
jgi:transcriptional regulator with XRE-family HTH domain